MWPFYGGIALKRLLKVLYHCRITAVMLLSAALDCHNVIIMHSHSYYIDQTKLITYADDSDILSGRRDCLRHISLRSSLSTTAHSQRSGEELPGETLINSKVAVYLISLHTDRH